MDEPKVQVFYEFLGSDDTALPFTESGRLFVEIELATGDVYNLTACTDEYYHRLREQAREMGINLGDHYSVPPNLIVASIESEFVQQVICDLIKANGLQTAWLVPDELTGLWYDYDKDDDAEADALYEESEAYQIAPDFDYGPIPACH